MYSKYTGADFPEISTRIFTILSFQNFGQGFVASWPIFYIYFKCTRALTFQNFCQGFVASWPRQCLRLIRERERSRPRWRRETPPVYVYIDINIYRTYRYNIEHILENTFYISIYKGIYVPYPEALYIKYTEAQTFENAWQALYSYIKTRIFHL